MELFKKEEKWIVMTKDFPPIVCSKAICNSIVKQLKAAGVNSITGELKGTHGIPYVEVK